MSDTSTFIHELKLKTTPHDMKVLEKRRSAGRQIYNGVLSECFKRLKLMRESKAYRQALKLPPQVIGSSGIKVINPQRKDLFKKARIDVLFREYDLHVYVKSLRVKGGFDAHIDSSTAQKLATRAFHAIQEYSFKKRGKPRFQSHYRFKSLEGKSNATGIRWIDGMVKWKGLEIPALFDLKDTYGLEAYALSQKTKYVRLVRRVIKGQVNWYVQLVQLGTPYVKRPHEIGHGVVGLDLGPSSIAIVGEDKAKLTGFCPEVIEDAAKIKLLQRKQARSLREMNPHNFEEDCFKANGNGVLIKKQGKMKSGPKSWCYSNAYLKRRDELAEHRRVLAAKRKSAHGRLANEVLSMGNKIKTEDLSYKAFQKRFGRSVGMRGPGMFMEILTRKAESAGGFVELINTRETALSQQCHCGHRKRKSLSQRWHHCEECGSYAQRDLYSAFLARFVSQNRLDTTKAQKAFAGVEALLEQAVSHLHKAANGKLVLASFGLGQRRSRSSAKGKSMPHEALDVVAVSS